MEDTITIKSNNDEAEKAGVSIPKGAIVQQCDIERNGTLVYYGIPNKEHNCDAMGCPTIGHILGIKVINLSHR